MNFRQDEEHQDILEMVHDFAVNEVKPLAAEIDRTEEFPMKNVKMMAEMGLMGIPFPEEYGGAGMDTLAYIQTVEELSKYCASTGVILSAHTSLCATPIYQFLCVIRPRSRKQQVSSRFWPFFKDSVRRLCASRST